MAMAVADAEVFDNDDLVTFAVDDMSIQSFALVCAALAAIDDNDDDVADIFRFLNRFFCLFSG